MENRQLLNNFLVELASQENSSLRNDKRVYPNSAPEDNGLMDIGFGHKIRPIEYEEGRIYGINFREGISFDDAYLIMQIDFYKCIAVVTPMYPHIPFLAVLLLADFVYNGAYNYFPKFKKAITERNKKDAFANYKRYWTKDGSRRELTRRNYLTKTILDQLVADGWLI